MFDLWLIYLGIYTCLMGTIILIGFIAQRKKEVRKVNETENIKSENVTVLIPFRNEYNRLPVILKSIKQLAAYPKEFVFIDDHSDDGGEQLIREALSGVRFSIITTPEDKAGKKEALRFGMEQVQSEYVITMDADVEIPVEYFKKINELPAADMYVLPVIMEPKRFMQYLYEIDLVLVTAANSGLAGLKRPIMASGANLLYRTETFNSVDDYASHAHAASGDDTYLLRDFRINKTDVRLHTDPDMAIRTETPQSFKEFIDQRLRWVGKTGDIKDHLSTFLAVLQALLTIGFFCFLIYFIVIQWWVMVLILLVHKSIVDLILFAPYFFRLKRYVTWVLIPIYELLFPLYTLIILALVFTYKPKWKGREIYKK
ncbi:MAG: glycosyltransferase [Crocinitomicaceae bacterium]|nr:glycosyltransferase [Crocinitomicaceae bacterium]